MPVAVVLVLSWVGARAVMLDEANARVDRELRGEAAELALLAEGVDPATGEPFDSARSLLRLSIERSLPDENETMFAIVDGVVVARSSDIPPARIDTDETFLASLDGLDIVTIQDVMTDAGRVRTIAVPVIVEGSDEHGVLVVGIFVDAETANVDAVMRALLVAWALALVVATIVGWFVSGRVLAPVRRVVRAARVVNASDLTERIALEPAASGDDVDALARTFNDMLDRLQAGFAAQRAFIDDAGHELRTPLTVARGHLDLMRVGDAAEAEQSRLVVLDELDRMSRIVHDMQTLTKATSPGFVRLAPVDVAEVADETFVKASALADRRWRLDESANVVVDADRQRLVQAMLQLAKNATAHTRPGDEIGIGVQTRGRDVVLFVRDTGPGVPPADRVRVFERFVRGSARADANADGAGLGLAIVAAIAQAHGGSARVVEASGGGARFEIVLPLTPPTTTHGGDD